MVHPAGLPRPMLSTGRPSHVLRGYLLTPVASIFGRPTLVVRFDRRRNVPDRVPVSGWTLRRARRHHLEFLARPVQPASVRLRSQPLCERARQIRSRWPRPKFGNRSGCRRSGNLVNHTGDHDQRQNAEPPIRERGNIRRNHQKNIAQEGATG